MKSPALLEVDHLQVYYGAGNRWVRAVEDVSFEIVKGQRMGLVGESGCGKSTVARAVLRLLPPTNKEVSGRILFDGVDLLRASEEEIRTTRGARISMLFQDPMTFLNPVMRVGDQISEAVMAHSDVGRHVARDRARDCLELVNANLVMQLHQALSFHHYQFPICKANNKTSF